MGHEVEFSKLIPEEQNKGSYIRIKEEVVRRELEGLTDGVNYGRQDEFADSALVDSHVGMNEGASDGVTVVTLRNGNYEEKAFEEGVDVGGDVD